jgi:predicted nucleic acid-binding protein
MILVDTSVIVAWLDKRHPHHEACTTSLIYWAERDGLGVSSVTFAELAAGARNREGVEEDLQAFARVDLNFDAAWRAGMAFRQYRSKGEDDRTVLPDFLIRGQAAVLGCRHLTNDRRRLKSWADVDVVFPEE